MLIRPNGDETGGVMARCVAFDKCTAQAISGNLHLLVVCNPDADPLRSALDSEAPSRVLVAPGDAPGRVLLVTMRQPHAPIQPATPAHGEPIRVDATGFLGLGDE